MKGKKFINVLSGLFLSTSLIVGSMFSFPLTAVAAHNIVANVHGTVASGTTDSMLYLNTAEGKMSIKLDADTNTTGCKLILPGSTVYAALYYGSDAYMHADTISSSASMTTTTSDSKVYTVEGSVANKSMQDNIMFVNLSTSGEMQVKIDSTTVYNCGPIYAGKGISMEVVRGDDAYMHAKTINDASALNKAVSGDAIISTTSTSQSLASTSVASVPTTAPNGAKVTPVTGTITADTKPGTGFVYLSSTEGKYTLKIDSSTSYANGYMLIQGQKITANIYRGDDAYMHVLSFQRTGSLSAASSGSTQLTFSGVVGSNSTDAVMYLATSGGTMTIRLDAGTVLNGNAPVLSGSKVSVVCTSCADAYWHANTITLTN